MMQELRCRTAFSFNRLPLDFLVFDARASFRLNENWTAAVSVENLGADDYILFHPFPQRTVIGSLNYRF